MLAKFTRRNKKNRRGQGMTEYIIIVGLIAIALITAVTNFKGALDGAFGAATNEVNTKVTGAINGGQGG